MKLKPWQIAAIAIAAGAIWWLYKKHQETIAAAEASTAAVGGVPGGEAGEGEGFPYSVAGAGGPGAGGIGGLEFAGFEQEQKQEHREQRSEEKTEREKERGETAGYFKKLEERLEKIQTGGNSTVNNGSGGGAPSEPKQGVTVAPEHHTCPPAFPHYNSKDGAIGPHSCFKSGGKKTGKCKAPPYQWEHVYQDGHTACSANQFN